MKQIPIDDLIKHELGSRSSGNGILVARIINSVALLWAIFQLIIASPLPFWLAVHFGISDFVLNDVESRSIHLTFALFLCFLSFPAFHSTQNQKIPIYDWLMAIIAPLCTIYLFVFYEDLAERVALPTSLDLAASFVGILLLLEAARRAIGLPIVVVAVLFLSYSYFGSYMPEIMMHKGQSLKSIASHEWLSSEGVFGVALGVSCGFVFLYVLFGALLDKAGAGNFFMKVSFALLGRFTGGPAKAAVVASGLMGMISGSSIANTITIGTFTIPMMKRMGLSAEKAAAIEVSAGINGQIMPPVMGAAAFLMSEFLSIPYVDIVQYAFVPAILVYITLLYIVHLEARKIAETIEIPQTPQRRKFYHRALLGCLSLCCFAIICGIVYFFIEGIPLLHIPGIKKLFRGYSFYAITVLLLVVYCAIIWYQSSEKRNESEELVDEGHIPDVWYTLKNGLHYFIPISILIWCLIVERLSSTLSCFWTICFLIFMLLTQNFLRELFYTHKISGLSQIKAGFLDLYHGMISASQNMMAIAVATGTAGIVVGSVSLTGFGLSIGGVIDSVASGSVFITLLMTAVICIVLGMGMPTTACYIIVSTLMVPVLKGVITQNNLNIPPVALHLFVFYFGLMADVTPPVGLASYAAAAIARGNAFKTGVQAFVYNIRTMILPFLFVFNPELILYNPQGFWQTTTVILTCLIGILILSSGMQGYFLKRNKFYESIALLVAGLTFIAPNFVLSLFIPPYYHLPMDNIQAVFSVSKGENVRITTEMKNFNGLMERKSMVITVKTSGEFTVHDMITEIVESNAGIHSFEENRIFEEKSLRYFKQKWKIIEIELPSARINPKCMYFVAIAITIMVALFQIRQAKLAQRISGSQ